MEGFQNSTEERVSIESQREANDGYHDPSILQEHIKNRLAESVQEVAMEDGAIEYVDGALNILENQNKSKDLSVETGQFFRNLIPNGLYKPTNDKVPGLGSHNNLINAEKSATLDFLVQTEDGAPIEDTRKSYKSLIESSIFNGKDPDSIGVVQETVEPDGLIKQVVINKYVQDGGGNTIYEQVDNFIDTKTNTNIPSSSLVIRDANTGMVLDLNNLLPKGYDYTPSEMNFGLRSSEGQKDKFGNNADMLATDLKDYKMGHNKPFHFGAVLSGLKLVKYGELRQKGGVMMLLHEVAHSWQDQYFNVSNRGKGGFTKILGTLKAIVKNLDIPKDNPKHTEPDVIWNELEKMGIVCLDKAGTVSPVHEAGVINIPNRHYKMVDLYRDMILHEKDEKMLQHLNAELEKHRSLLRFYPMKGDVLDESIYSFVAEERDAWAHAIRTIRFLRSKGFDVEPELQTLNDFKQIINPCLDSYQRGVEDNILHTDMDYRFSKKH
jgi:hypothetical protein